MSNEPIEIKEPIKYVVWKAIYKSMKFLAYIFCVTLGAVASAWMGKLILGTECLTGFAAGILITQLFWF